MTELDPNAVALKGAAALVFIKQKGREEPMQEFEKQLKASGYVHRPLPLNHEPFL
ncbi:hypothetical protein [uncultured Enterococcus sp.]|uniref:hypothetical protein n=1 Tax=uncultured Enterococcus sp. TaxID=167972 RepID=UPI002AA69B42|nr:hypothetical protein [uncultured Enterococcus sp.]